MKSMTGYAKRQCAIDGTNIIIEIKTLNSKQIDCNVKIPSHYRSKELEIRNMLNRLERGKIDFILTEEDGGEKTAKINKELAVARYNELQELAKDLNSTMSTEKILACVIEQPDVWTNTQNEEMSEVFWSELRGEIEKAIEDVDVFRKHEGEILELDFVKHVDLIEKKLMEVPKYEQERIETAKERIRRYLTEMSVKEIDENRFEQELIYYLEKLDITEEKVRLAKHIEYFRNTMKGEESCGKKLSFVAQEMGREINTTGSKANHVEIQKLVVEMKDELEKIKEQLGNIL